MHKSSGAVLFLSAGSVTGLVRCLTQGRRVLWSKNAVSPLLRLGFLHGHGPVAFGRPPGLIAGQILACWACPKRSGRGYTWSAPCRSDSGATVGLAGFRRPDR